MHKWSISAKLMAGFMGLVVCVGALGLASLWAVNGLRDDLGEMSDKILRKSELAADVQVNTWNVRAEMRAMLLAAALKRPQDVQKARSNAEQAYGRLDSSLREIHPLLTDDKAKAAADGIASILPQWKDAFHEIADLAAAGKVDAAYKVRAEKEAPLAIQIEQAPTAIREGARTAADLRLGAANQRALSNRWLIAAFIATGLLLGALVFFMVRSMAGTLRHITLELASGADQVAAASGQIAATSQSLSQGSSEQASAVEEVSESMQKMSGLAGTVIRETTNQVDNSNAALTEMVGSMNSIKASSERVAKINRTIDEIAFQTNILALNAAVEAARAGEAGKGFAVVADEVRNLAQRAAAAAKDTAALIEESIVNSNQGVLKVEMVSEAIRGITRSSAQIKTLVGEGEEAGRKDGSGSIQQVSAAIQQVSVVTQSNASAAEESAAAAEELNAQSMTVRELAGNLRRLVDGGEEPAATLQVPRHFAGAKARSAVTITEKKRVAERPEEFPMGPAEAGSFHRF